jgi:hypothetical protein
VHPLVHRPPLCYYSPNEMSEDGSSSIEKGMTLGYGYAERHRGDRLSLGRIARAHSAAEVTANVDPAEVAADGLADPVAFWSGFAHGVRSYLLEKRQTP